MKKTNKEFINPGGVNGTGEGVVNINSKDYIGLQAVLKRHAQKQSSEQKIKYGLLALRYQMESYISTQSPQTIMSAGVFLKKHLEVIKVKHKEFAKYIGIDEPNLSSILKGRRKINIDLAFKLGRIFNVNPDLWLLVQSKSELLKIDSTQLAKYDRFQLDDLLKKAG